MAIINFYTKKPESNDYDLEIVHHKKGVADFILNNIESGCNFHIYEGEINKSNEISRNYEKVKNAKEVSVFTLPAADPFTIAVVAIAVLATVLLTPKIPPLGNLNRNQQSPNNSLSDRNNRARPQQRIVDICGKVKSIPDVLSREYARYVNNQEERIGYYCIGRNKLLVEDIKDSDTLMGNIEGSSVGVYEPFTSPNNSAPSLQIGEPINELVYGVYESPDAISQTIKAPNEGTLILDGSLRLGESGYILDPDDTFDFTESFSTGDKVELLDVYLQAFRSYDRIGAQTTLVTAVEKNKITFDISNDTSWSLISTEEDIYLAGSDDPRISKTEVTEIGPFRITAEKVNRLLVNVSALNGVYKENSKGRKNTDVSYTVYYQKLDDEFNYLGPKTPIEQTISGRDSNEKGLTTDIDLGGLTYVEWSIERTTPIDFTFDGNIVDEIKMRSVFGLYSVNNSDFGNVTTIQTRRTSNSATSAIRNPELNCIATELVQKYEGNGVFDTNYTENTKAMQSLIRLALDPFVGRRVLAELDADLLLENQQESEDYFQSLEAGSFNYSFDSTALSAQETFKAIGDACFMTLWREGRVLKSWFEKPQSLPSMVFTHRSKQANSETWNRKRNTAEQKDGIEFVYTDSNTYKKETLYYPADRSAKNPVRSEMTGIKGEQHARWHMMRQFNKLTYQEVTVDFSSTREGRFVKPKKLISVVKGSRIKTFDGNITAINGLELTLSQDVEFTENDDHYIILKDRDGTAESLLVTSTESKNKVRLLQLPSIEIYAGNSALKTEFSLGSESRLLGQLMVPEEIAPTDGGYVNIKAVNYSDLYYKDDTPQPIGRAYSDGFSEGYL